MQEKKRSGNLKTVALNYLEELTFALLLIKSSGIFISGYHRKHMRTGIMKQSALSLCIE